MVVGIRSTVPKMTTLDAEGLRVLLINMLGRVITVKEMHNAMGLKASTYYGQVREGRLVSLDNLRAAAHSLGINEVYLLVECGLLDRKAAGEYAQHVASGVDGPMLTPPKNIREVRKSRPETPDL